jgi:hypothetical protein
MGYKLQGLNEHSSLDDSQGNSDVECPREKSKEAHFIP